MRDLKEFKNIHPNSDIYIICSGPSLDFIDRDFFNNKITIGINQIYKKLNVKYLVRKETKLLHKVINETKDTIHFISKGNCGGGNIDNLKIVRKKYSDRDIVIYEHPPNVVERPITKGFFCSLKEDSLIVSWSTVTTAIHLAMYMGAKNIILVGHDCGTLNNKCNTNGYHDNASYKIAHVKGEEDYRKWLPKIEKQTLELKSVLKEVYNCNVYSLNPFINFGLEGNTYSK